jgi:DNA (cytosine-5)-methyltransferase 1
MKFFSMFSGVGGFEIAIQQAHDSRPSRKGEENIKNNNNSTDTEKRNSWKSPSCVGGTDEDNKDYGYAFNSEEKNSRHSCGDKSILEGVQERNEQRDSSTIKSADYSSRALFSNGQESCSSESKSLDAIKTNTEISNDLRQNSNGDRGERAVLRDDEETLQHQRYNADFDRFRKPICVGVCEWDKYSSQVLKKRFSGVKNYGDATKINTEELPDFDMLVGGFPCQAFSIAGNRRGFDDTRGTMFFEIARVLKAKRPEYCVLENVKGLLSHDKGKTFLTIISTLQELGYNVEWGVLNSRYFGVPQNRERVFIIGGVRERGRTKVFPLYRGNKQNTLETGREVLYSLDANYHKGTNRLDKGRRQMVAQRVPLKFLNRNQKQIEGDYAFTVDSMNTGGIREGVSIRKLTPVECERLQGFKDNWTLVELDNGKMMSDTQRYKQMGNAVTVNVVQAIMEEIIWTNQQ